MSEYLAPMSLHYENDSHSTDNVYLSCTQMIRSTDHEDFRTRIIQKATILNFGRD
jgi:hypothetical protein